MKRPTRVLENLSTVALVLVGALGLWESIFSPLLDIQSLVPPQSLILAILSLLALGLGLERWALLNTITNNIGTKLNQIETNVRRISKSRTVLGYEASFKATELWISELEEEIITFAVMETGGAPEDWVTLLLERMQEMRNTRKRPIKYKVWIWRFRGG